MNTHNLKFLNRAKREPAVQPLPSPLPKDTDDLPDSVKEWATQQIEQRQTIAYLKSENESLRVDLRVAIERIKMLESALSEAERKRDFYQFHSTSLVTRLNDIRMTVDAAVREAEHEAFKPRDNAVPTPLPAMDPVDEQAMQSLAKKLAPEQPDA